MAENTEFEQMGLVALKKLLEVGNPDRVHEVSGHWGEVNDELLAVAQELGKIVQDAQQHWEGAAADGFARAAGRIQQSLTNTAGYAKNTSDAMKHAGDSLQQAKTAMARIPVPSTLDSGFKDVTDGFDHSDTQFKADLASGMDRITAVNKNYGSLSAMEVSHQYAIGVMEHLAPQYTKAASYMQTPSTDTGHVVSDYQVYPPPPSNPTPPGGIEPSPMPEPRYPDTTTTGSDGSGHQPGSTGTNDPGMPASPGSPSTGIDGWTPPAVGGPVSGGGFTGGGGVTGGPGLGAGTGGGFGGGFGGGVGVLPIGGIGSGSGVGFNRPSGTGTGALGAGASGAGEEEGMPGAGRSGIGGMRVPGGLGGAEGEGESPGGLGGRSGGAVGGARPGGASGKAFTEGGTGLGRNRPGQSGMGSGMPGAHGGGKKDKQRGKRPGYLVEDEDTWRSNGRANPPVIE